MASYEAYLGVGIDGSGAKAGAAQVDGAMRKVAESANKTTGATKAMQRQIQQAQAAMKSQERQIGELSHTLETHRVALGQARRAVEMKQRQIDALKQTMMQYENMLKQVNQTVSVQTREIDKLKKALEQKNSALEKNKQELAKYQQQISTATTALKIFIAAVGVLAVREIATYTQALSSARAVTNASAEDMLKLEKITRQLGASTAFSAADAANGAKFLGQAGFTINEIIAALPATMDLAAAATLDMGQASSIAANIMSGFGIAASDVGRATDVLAAISSAANTDVVGLGEAMKYAGPISKSLGISLEDTAAAMGVLANNGIQGGQAGRNFRTAISDLVNPSKQARQAIFDMGLSMRDLNPQTKSLIEIMKTLKTANMSAADAFKIFGNEGATAMLALVDNVPMLEKMTAVTNSATGSAKRMSEIKLDNLSGDFEKLTGELSEAAMAVGSAGLEGALRSYLQTATQWVESLNKSFAALVKNKEQVALLSDAFTALAYIVSGLVAIKAAEWVAGLAVALYGATTAATAFNAAVLGIGGVTVGALAYLVKLRLEIIDLEKYTRKQEEALLDMAGATGEAARQTEIAILQMRRAQMRSSDAIIGDIAAMQKEIDGIGKGYLLQNQAMLDQKRIKSEQLSQLQKELSMVDDLKKKEDELVVKKITTSRAYQQNAEAARKAGLAAMGFVTGNVTASPVVSGSNIGSGSSVSNAKPDKNFFGVMGGVASASSEYEDTSKLFWKTGEVVSSTTADLNKYKEKNLQIIEALQIVNEKEKVRNDLLKQYGGDMQKVNQELAIRAEIQKLNVFATSEEEKAIRDAVVATNQLTEANKKLSENAQKAKDSQREWTNQLTYAFKDAIMNSKNLGDALSNLANRVQDMLVNKALDSLLGGMFESMKFAKGAAFQAGGVTAFASGGVVNSPTMFPMRGGVGLMGEAGAEAIMPLTRTSNGDLGVKAVGGGTVVQTEINITVQGGTKEQNDDAGRKVSAAVKQAIDDSVISVILREKRPGGVLNAA